MDEGRERDEGATPALAELLGCDPGEVPFSEVQASAVAEVLDEVRTRRARRRTGCATDEAA